MSHSGSEKNINCRRNWFCQTLLDIRFAVNLIFQEFPFCVAMILSFFPNICKPEEKVRDSRLDRKEGSTAAVLKHASRVPIAHIYSKRDINILVVLEIGVGSSFGN